MHVAKLLTHSTLPNLFDDHPPFQIDGNFGGLAGVCEMILQSHEMRWEDNRPLFLLDLLPAWPFAHLPDGEAQLRARGGVEVTLRWTKGTLAFVHIASAVWLGGGAFAPLPAELRLRVPERTGLAVVAGSEGGIEPGDGNELVLRPSPGATGVAIRFEAPTDATGPTGG